MNSWIYLIVAGLFEVGWAISLKFSEGFSKLIPSLSFLIFLILSMLFLELSIKNIALGTAYACWTAIGAIGTMIIGMLFFNESTSVIRFLFLFLIIVGIVGLKLTTA